MIVVTIHGRRNCSVPSLSREMPSRSTTLGCCIAKAEAQFNLGTLYFNGEGVPKDNRHALRWFRLAADQEEAVAQTKIAIMYDDGRGVPHDIVQAYKWYSLAATNGDKPAAELRDASAKQMTPAQIAEAQKLAREWKPKTPSASR